MTAALLAFTPRINYRALYVAFFIGAYPLWHADFPTVSVEHIDVVPAAQDMMDPASDNLAASAAQGGPPAIWVRHCRG